MKGFQVLCQEGEILHCSSSKEIFISVNNQNIIVFIIIIKDAHFYRQL